MLFRFGLFWELLQTFWSYHRSVQVLRSPSINLWTCVIEVVAVFLFVCLFVCFWLTDIVFLKTKTECKCQLKAIIISLNFSGISQPAALENFNPPASTFTIAREKLIVKLNTAPRIPPEVVKPTSKVTHKSNDVTIGIETSSNRNITTNRNLVSQVNIMHN